VDRGQAGGGPEHMDEVIKYEAHEWCRFRLWTFDITTYEIAVVGDQEPFGVKGNGGSVEKDGGRIVGANTLGAPQLLYCRASLNEVLGSSQTVNW
jgi:hypothetical protein